MNKNADKHLTTFPYENYYCMTQYIPIYTCIFYIVYTYNNIMNIYLYRYHYARFTDRHRVLVD